VRPKGNNSEAISFAQTLTEISQQTWPKAHAVWDLELTPQEIGGDIVSYRMHVSHCKAIVSMSDDWLQQTENDQRSFIRTSLNILHQAPAFPTGQVDYYPNSSGEVAVIVGSRTVAHGTYTREKTAIQLEPGTFLQKDSSAKKYTATFAITNNGGIVSFNGTTNLPEGQSILVTLEGHGFSGQTKVTVSGGHFQTERFSNAGRPLSPGIYSLQFNVFNPETALMIEAQRKIDLSSIKTVEMSFKPVELGK
jgi:hypothetical protein